MANGGPWGGGNRGDGRGNGGDGDGPEDRGPDRLGDRRPPRRPEGSQIPEIDQLVNRGREQLRVLMGGRGGPTPPGGGMSPPRVTRGTLTLAGVAAVVLWGFMSVYTVRPEEQSVELFLGSFSSIGNPGLNFAPWPLVTYEVVNVTSERTEAIGASSTGGGSQDNPGLMLTTDANIVDIGFQVVWNVNDPSKLLFNISDPELTVRAVSESVMREIIAASNLAPILNRDRGVIADTARENIQASLDAYESGISIVRVNLDRADPPAEVIDAFRDVQAAEQERDTLQRQADAYANQALAASRGDAARVIEQAEAYRAQVVNDSVGQASRFSAVLGEYQNAEQVTRERLYIETMERVLGDVNKVILDPSITGGAGGQGVVPFLPLDQFVRPPAGATPSAAPAPAAAGAASTTLGN